MPRNSHSDDLRDARAAHVANGGSSQIVKFQLRYFGRRARRDPGRPKILDRRTGAVKHAVAAVRVVPRPFEPCPHVARDDRHRAGVAALRVPGIERD